MYYNKNKKVALCTDKGLGLRYLSLLRCISYLSEQKKIAFNTLLNGLDTGFKIENDKNLASKKICDCIYEIDKIINNSNVSNSVDNSITFPRETEYKRFHYFDLLSKKIIQLFKRKKQIQITRREINKLYHHQYKELLPIIVRQSKNIDSLLKIKLHFLNNEIAFPHQYRIKEWESVLDKFYRIYPRVTHLNEMQDIIGFRIVTIFEKDIVKIEKVINRHFKIIRKYIPNYAFNSSSIHIVIKKMFDHEDLDYEGEVNSILVEFQIMTLAQFTYLKASNALTYKKRINKKGEEILNRTSALLDVLDLEMTKLYNCKY